MPQRLSRMVAAYPELLLVVAAAAIGLVAHRPLRWLDGHDGINVLLAVLVFATALTVSTEGLGRLWGARRAVGAVLVIGAVVLPALSWVASRLVVAGPLRHGVMAVGLAPCEIASMATTGLAGGDSALAAVVLIGSTVTTVAIAGPVLSLVAGHTSVQSGHIVVNLALVVALPLVAGLMLRATAGVIEGHQAVAVRTATAALAGLVALVAAEIRLGRAYFAVLAAIVIIVGVSAVIGVALGRITTTETATALILTISMRDFAIAAGLASAAFGPPAAAPLGLYGVSVLVWGTAVAGRIRVRHPGGGSRP